MQADRKRQFTGQHITGAEQQAEDDDVEHAQPGRILIRRMRQANEDCWNHHSDDDPPPCSGDSPGQVLDRVSAIGRLLPESYRRNGNDADQDRGNKGPARGRGKAASNVHPIHGELHDQNPEQQQHAQHQPEAEVDPPGPA